MDKNHGYVKLYRSIMDWGWYRDSATFRLFVHCLLKANFVEKEWMERKIPVGSLATSLGTLCKELGLSIDKIRTAIKHLISTHEITYEGTSRYSIITVNSFNRYQQTNLQNPKHFPNVYQTFPNN